MTKAIDVSDLRAEEIELVQELVDRLRQNRKAG